MVCCECADLSLKYVHRRNVEAVMMRSMSVMMVLKGRPDGL